MNREAQVSMIFLAILIVIEVYAVIVLTNRFCRKIDKAGGLKVLVDRIWYNDNNTSKIGVE